jgi:hypothetical protein
LSRPSAILLCRFRVFGWLDLGAPQSDYIGNVSEVPPGKLGRGELVERARAVAIWRGLRGRGRRKLRTWLRKAGIQLRIGGTRQRELKHSSVSCLPVVMFRPAVGNA